MSDFNAEGPPVPIPNTEVKLCCGDNTWREAAREDSSSLTLTKAKAVASNVVTAIATLFMKHKIDS